MAWWVAIAALALAGFFLRRFLLPFETGASLWVVVLAITLTSFVGFSLFALVKGLGDMRNLLRRPDVDKKLE